MKTVVLVSGGLDSAVCLAKAIDANGYDNVVALSMYYGQKHSKELECAKKLTDYYGVNHIVRDLSEVFSLSDCSLLQGGDDIPTGTYAEQQLAEGKVISTYVPFRNGLFLSYAASIAYSVGAAEISYGAHANDAAGDAYPDCTIEFIDYIRKAIYRGTGEKVFLDTPIASMDKGEVVELGLKLNVPFDLTWSCYNGGEQACGTCSTCIDRQAAFIVNGEVDPIEYMSQD